ncbi:MAG: hypothetical protein GC185_06585 [Alphaproteobacteria bacterium]|nr:hypothetical protein [Alphaproteobacteria bacterium]
MARTDDKTDDGRFDTLMVALGSVWADKFAVVSDMLAEQSIDLNKKDGKGRTPLHLLAENYTGHDYDLQIVKLFLQKGARLDATTPDGSTVLHSAVRSWQGSNKPGMVMLLLESGADTQVLDRQGKTPMDIALVRRKTEAEQKSLTDFFEKYASRPREIAKAEAEAAERKMKSLAEKARQAPRLKKKP